jgi:hypothetical protein
MKTKNIILIIIIAAIALGIGVFIKQHNTPMQSSSKQGHHDIWYCPMHPHYTSDHPGRCPICGMDLVKRETVSQKESPAKVTEKKILYWTDTMLPGYKSDHPGKSPMGMDLTPVYEKEPIQQGPAIEGYTTIAETAQRQQLIGLRTQVVGVKPVVKLIRTFGTIASAAELYKTQNEFIDAYVAYVNAYRDYKRIRGRQHIWESHRDVQIGLLEAKDKLLKLGLSDGEIAKLQDVSWNQIWKQPKLLLFNNSRSYWVMAQIFEQDFSFVQEGQEVEVGIPSYHVKIKGVIRSVGGFIDPTSRSVTALIELVNYKKQLVANMLLDISIPVKLGDGLLVPRQAVMDTGLRKVIFVCKPGNTFEPREIQTGWETDDGYEVKSGLKEGERIVVSGNFLLDSESRVQAGLQEDTATATGGEAHGK